MIQDDEGLERRPARPISASPGHAADTRVGRLLAARARLILRNYPRGSRVRFGPPGPDGAREYRVFVPGAESVLATLDALEGA